MTSQVDRTRAERFTSRDEPATPCPANRGLDSARLEEVCGWSWRPADSCRFGGTEDVERNGWRPLLPKPLLGDRAPSRRFSVRACCGFTA